MNDYNEITAKGRKISKDSIQTCYRLNNILIKAFNPKLYGKADVFYMASIESRIEKTQVKSPNILDVTELNDGRWAIAEKWVEGTLLSEKLLEVVKLKYELDERCNSLNGGASDDDFQKKRFNDLDLDAVLEQFLNVQIRIHKEHIRDIPNQKHYLRNKIKKLKGVSKSVKYDLLSALDEFPQHDKLCHGNLSPRNLVVTDDNEICVTGWYFAWSGNSASDIAMTYLKLCCIGTEIAERYLRLYCKITGTQLNYVRKWIPIMAAHQLDNGTSSKIQTTILQAYLCTA